MNFLYIRKKGRNPPAGVITVAMDGKNLGLAFCAPQDAWVRARGRAIATARACHNPITVEQTRGTDVLDAPDLASAAIALIQDRPDWSRSPDPESRTWNASTIGPDGSMFHFCIATSAQLPDVPAPRSISWMRVPSWAPQLIQESQ